MNRLTPPPGKRLTPTHGLCRGLRLFSRLDCLTPRNVIGGQTATGTNTPTTISGPAGTACRFVRASDQRLTFSAPIPAPSGSVTCIVCAKPTLPTGNVPHQLAGTWDDGAGLKKGFLLYATDFAAELGVTMIVGDGAGATLLRNTGDQTCFDGDWHIFAGRYHAGDGIVRVYQDGRQKNGDSASTPGYNVGTAVGLQIGGNSATSALAATAAIAWVAVFDVALTEGEVRGWSSGRWEMFEHSRSAMIVVPATPPNSSARVLATGRYRR